VYVAAMFAPPIWINARIVCRKIGQTADKYRQNVNVCILIHDLLVISFNAVVDYFWKLYVINQSFVYNSHDLKCI